ncbi:MAG: hypothetical protein HY321_22760 [Armatimonadetes bacterium]|nr:hypothetical protein [Armatimonadota bacterium]
MRNLGRSLARAACVLLITQLGACSASASDARPTGTPPDIFPTPKQMTLTQARLDLVRDGRPAAILVLGDQPTRQSEIAAAEINDAVQAACGAALPVKRLGTLTATERQASSLILIGGPGENALLTREGARLRVKVSARDPGPQGYAIRFAADGRRRLALLAGSDPLGTLYAAVTFRSLVRGGDGQAHALEANIRDWPDVRWRHTWSRLNYAIIGRAAGDPEGQLAAARKEMDWLLRHKINLFFSYHAGTKAAHAILGEEMQPWFRQVLQYAFDRGIWGCTFPTHDNLGFARKGETRPDLEVCFHYQHSMQASYYWCWSRDEEMDRRFEEAARDVAANMPADPGIGGMFFLLHMPDTGNMGWHKRCERCRQRFGNDQAAGMANVFNHFYRAMRRHIPNSRLILVPRPYEFYDLNAPKNGIYRDRFTRLARLIPADSFIVKGGEGTREAFLSWVQAVGSRGMAHWAFPFQLARTIYSEKRDDVFLFVTGGLIEENPLSILGAAEYLWNVRAPGSKEARLDKEHPYNDVKLGDEGDTQADVGKQDGQGYNGMVDGAPFAEWGSLPLAERVGPEVMGFLERAARHLYGEEAAPHLLRVYAADTDALGFGGMASGTFTGTRPATSFSGGSQLNSEAVARMVPVLEAGAASLGKVVREGIPISLDYRHFASPARVLNLELATSLARAWAPLLKATAAVDASQWTAAAEAVSQVDAVLKAEADRLRAVYKEYDTPPEAALERLRAVGQFGPRERTYGVTLKFYLTISKARVWVPLVKAQKATANAQWTLATEALTEAEKAVEAEAERLRAIGQERYPGLVKTYTEELRQLAQPEIDRLRGLMKPR